ncbi:MAG: GNAT family N-acetyltransferase [Candidatus Competibacteraceae bacterium]|nr:GNAT family N-acetyltransferase [Candidatus Competibacteraceae bacterium]
MERDILEADLQALLARNPGWIQDYAEFIAWQIDKPYVDFIRVDEDYRRQGIAKAMYLKGADMLAKEFRLPLYASTLQQEHAKLVWDSIAADGYPVFDDWHTDNGEPKKRIKLDFRMVPDSNGEGILAT